MAALNKKSYMIKKISLVFFLIVFCVNMVFSLKLSLKIKLPNSIKSDKIFIMFDNGYEQKPLKIKFKNNIGFVNEIVFSPYGSIILVYPNEVGTMYGVNFLIKADAPSYIKFYETNELDTNKLIKYSIKNVIAVHESKENLKIKQYCKIEVDSNIYYSNKYNEIKSDSITNLYILSCTNLALKQLEYLEKKKNKSYLHSWFFRTEIVRYLKKTHKKELLYFFDNNLPESYQKSDEGKFLRGKLEGSLYVKEGAKAPQFAALDYKGDSVSLEKFKGKYVLVDFWATWCAPCLEKISAIKKLRNDYDSNYLQIISITYDRDSTKFIDGINRYELNWLHIFGNPKIKNAYGDTPIPALYLIDPDGIICYSSWESNIDKIFAILKKAIE